MDPLIETIFLQEGRIKALERQLTTYTEEESALHDRESAIQREREAVERQLSGVTQETQLAEQRVQSLRMSIHQAELTLAGFEAQSDDGIFSAQINALRERTESVNLTANKVLDDLKTNSLWYSS